MVPPEPHENVQSSYDAVASTYADRFLDELDHKPLDRALLATVLETAGPNPHIVDLGCGPGHVTGWLAHHGANAVGVDLSPAMVDVATRHHPTASFRVGDFLSLPTSDGEFTAAVALYSLIHLSEEEIPRALAEIHRTLTSHAPLLIAVHVGSGVIHRDDWFDRAVNLDFRLFEMATLRDALVQAKFDVTAELIRAPYDGEANTTRGYLLARRH